MEAASRGLMRGAATKYPQWIALTHAHAPHGPSAKTIDNPTGAPVHTRVHHTTATLILFPTHPLL